MTRPSAVNDAATVTEDARRTAIDVLANDTDIDGGPKLVQSKTDGTHGSGRDHRRRLGPHLHPPRQLLRPRLLHLHPQRRLHGDGLGHGHLRR